jgi:hypothetical protein
VQILPDIVVPARIAMVAGGESLIQSYLLLPKPSAVVTTKTPRAAPGASKCKPQIAGTAIPKIVRHPDGRGASGGPSDDKVRASTAFAAARRGLAAHFRVTVVVSLLRCSSQPHK